MQSTSTIVLTEELFNRLFLQYKQKLFVLAYGMVRSKEVAQDIVNESFMVIWETRDSIQANNIEAYLFGIVRNRCLKYRRSQLIGKNVFEKIQTRERGVMEFYTHAIESCNPEEMFRTEIMEICENQLGQMPELTRRIFVAQRIDGKSYKEIADEFNISTKKVDKELQRVASKLRISLKDYLGVLLLLILIYFTFDN